MLNYPKVAQNNVPQKIIKMSVFTVKTDTFLVAGGRNVFYLKFFFGIW